MKKKVSDKKKMIIVFFILLLLSIVADVSTKSEIKDGYVERDVIGGEEKELELKLDAEGVLEDYTYSIEIPSRLPKEDEAEKYFEEAIAQIEKDFSNVKTEVPIKENYRDGVVKADWSFQPFGIIDSDGAVRREKLDENGTIMQAQVELRCGVYEEIYTFSFLLKPPVLSEKEDLLQKVNTYLENQKLIEGSERVLLPEKIGANELIWSEKREYITPQVLLLEIIALILLSLISKRKREEAEKKRLAAMEKDYPDIVNQLSLLLGAGMTTRQAWNRMSTQYGFKRDAGMIEKREVYEAIGRMNRRFAEGESERAIYQQFTEEIPASSYRKLMRLLLGNLEKGTAGIGMRLEEERRLAFEQRILIAKKQGEEASTKMLLPLMLMMMIVMGIVMLPALMKFQI